jgi:hypothetical protein
VRREQRRTLDRDRQNPRGVRDAGRHREQLALPARAVQVIEIGGERGARARSVWGTGALAGCWERLRSSST